MKHKNGAGPGVAAEARKNPEKTQALPTTPAPERIQGRRPKAETAATLRLMVEKFPAVFVQGGPRPLKIGIRDDLLAALPETPPFLGIAIGFYCNSRAYLEACVAGVPRVDLGGNPCGTVTPAEAAHAIEKLAKLAKRRIAAAQARRRKRLTISDLREAAKRRRGGVAP